LFIGRFSQCHYNALATIIQIEKQNIIDNNVNFYCNYIIQYDTLYTPLWKWKPNNDLSTQEDVINLLCPLHNESVIGAEIKGCYSNFNPSLFYLGYEPLIEMVNLGKIQVFAMFPIILILIGLLTSIYCVFDIMWTMIHLSLFDADLRFAV
jgi:hypothetical protein